MRPDHGQEAPILASAPATALAGPAKTQEDPELDGVLAARLHSTPFIPLAFAATAD